MRRYSKYALGSVKEGLMAELQPGETIGGRYRLEQRLGAGGMGEVWLAELHGAGAFRRRVVLKMLAPERRGDERLASMLADEARVVGMMHHPGIVAAIDYLETEENGPVFVLEFVDGASLRAILKLLRKQGAVMPEQLTAYVGAQIALALHAAHTAPLAIIHRDVAPDNVLISRDGAVCLGDFGVARARGNWEVTNPGAAPKGKRAYMAPEQAMGEQVGPAADIYALGRVIFEATAPGPKLTKVLERATSLKPEQRQTSAAELAMELMVACPPPLQPKVILAAWLTQNAGEALLARSTSHGATRYSAPPAGHAPRAPELFKSVPKPSRTWLRVAVFALALVFGGLWVNAHGGTRFITQAFAGTPTSQHGELKITSRPGEAEVYVDGSLRGVTPLSLDLTAGKHSLRLGAPRMERFRAADVFIKEGVEHHLDVDLSQ
jgi:Protein kinase domain/PEGA domain